MRWREVSRGDGLCLSGIHSHPDARRALMGDGDCRHVIFLFSSSLFLHYILPAGHVYFYQRPLGVTEALFSHFICIIPAFWRSRLPIVYLCREDGGCKGARVAVLAQTRATIPC